MVKKKLRCKVSVTNETYRVDFAHFDYRDENKFGRKRVVFQYKLIGRKKQFLISLLGNGRRRLIKT